MLQHVTDLNIRVKIPSSVYTMHYHSSSPLQEASIHRKALEEMQGTVTSELASLEQMQQAQDQLLEEQLAEIREQQRMAEDLLQGDLSLHTPRDSPRPLRPPTFYLDRDIFEVQG